VTDDAEAAFQRAMAAAKRLEKAWEKRAESRDELSRALEAYHEAGKALADEWNRAEE
jgi:hypothetical protein